MIKRAWGVVNSTHVEFTRVPDRPDYWEGIAPRVRGLQDIEIWAENDKGARGHYKRVVKLEWYSPTQVKLVLLPYEAFLVHPYDYSYEGGEGR